ARDSIFLNRCSVPLNTSLYSSIQRYSSSGVRVSRWLFFSITACPWLFVLIGELVESDKTSTPWVISSEVFALCSRVITGALECSETLPLRGIGVECVLSTGGAR